MNLALKKQPVLVIGGTGYVGGRLIPRLLQAGYEVRAIARSISKMQGRPWANHPNLEIIQADLHHLETLEKALQGCWIVYYLVHSMMPKVKDFAKADRHAVQNFIAAAKNSTLRRVIYLGGLGGGNESVSIHLKSRHEVGKILKSGPIPTTIFQSAQILGSGSASFEILSSIVRNAPFYFNPSWAHTRCQPIGIRDVIKYLVGVLETEETVGNTYDIGGDDVLSYQEMMRIMAKLMRKRRLFLPSPISNIKLYSYIISLISPVPAQIIACLLESVKNDVVVSEYAIREHIDFKTIKFKVTLLRSLSREEHDKIATRWSDAYPPAHELAIKLTELSQPPRYISSYSIVTEKEASSLFKSVCQIGGKLGWFNTNWMWRLRGSIDRIFMGVGTSRGRRSASSLRINDVIDFWRVEALSRNKRLLLRAEMILPGKAWLEFIIEEKEQHNILSVVANFQPKGTWGRLYWYIFVPFHYFIFKDLLKQLSK